MHRWFNIVTFIDIFISYYKVTWTYTFEVVFILYMYIIAATVNTIAAICWRIVIGMIT